MRLLLVVAGLIVAGGTAHAADHTGRTSCGAYTLNAYAARGAGEPGSFHGRFCDGTINVSGTATTITSVRITAGGKSYQLRANLAAPDPSRIASIESFLRLIDGLRKVAETLQKLDDTSFVDKVFTTNTTLEAGVRTTQNDSEVACSNPAQIAATLGTAAYIDFESSIAYRDYYVPPHCTVISYGKVDVTNLRVDGLLVRMAGGIKAGTLRGSPPGGVGLGRIIAVGAQVQGTVGDVLNATLDIGPAHVVANDIELTGVTLDAAAVEAQRITLTAGGAIHADQLVRAHSVSVSRSSIKARALEHATLDVRDKGSVSADDYIGVRRALAGGTATAAVTVDNGGVITKGRMHVATLSAKRSASIKTEELECPAIAATSGSLVRAGRRLAGKKIDLADSRLSGGDVFVTEIVAKSSGIAVGNLEAARVSGTDTGVLVRSRMLVRAAPGTITLARGSLVVSTQALDPDDPATPPGTAEPTEPEGEPAFATCLAKPAGLDATSLVFDGTDVSIRHTKLTTLRGKGGRYRPIRHAGVRGVPRATMCLEVADTARLDGTYVAASRLYAALGSGKLVGATEFAADEGGDLARTGSRRIHNEDHADGTGASFGGYGGTHGNLAGADFLPALTPVDHPREFREGGLGGMGGDKQAIVNGHAAGFPGAGVIRIVARDLVLDGKVHADGRTYPDGIEGAGGGSGGSIFLAISGNLSGKGLITANGGDGGFARTRGGTGGGGSGGRIRIEHASTKGWRGIVNVFGGLGGRHNAQMLASERTVPPWVDWRNHGGPGTIYWKRADGRGQIVIEGPPLKARRHRGVGFITGDVAGEEVIIKNAFVVSSGLKARSLSLVNNAVLTADDPRVRLEWPPTAPYFSAGPYDARKGTNPIDQVDFPNDLWQEPLEEKVAVELTGDLAIDRTSRLDLTGVGGYSQSATIGNGSHPNRAGGSHGGLGGLGKFGKRQSIGRPNDSSGAWAEPTAIGEGGWGDAMFDKKRHKIGSLGGAGGGALRVIVEGTAKIDGRVAADGAPGAPFFDTYDDQGGTGGGAGGSVWLSARALAGKGTISAAGGNGSASPKSGAHGGGGGGGRVRLDVTTDRAWRGSVHASGGTGGVTDASTPTRGGDKVWRFSAPWQDVRYDGGPGTVYWVKGAGRLVIDGRRGGKGLGRIGGDTVERASTVELRRARVLADDLTAEQLVIKDGSVLAPNDPRVQRLYLDGFAHPFDAVTLPAKPAKAQLAIAVRRLDVDRKSRIDAAGLGGYGATACVRNCAFTNRAGGSHGGKGGTGRATRPNELGEPSPVAGDPARPTTPGEGGWGATAAAPHELRYQPCSMGGAGGGALRIDVAETFTLAGTVTASGGSAPAERRCETGYDAGGGGAGGSIWITAGKLVGRGTLAANGGNGTQSTSGSGGGGGGGRISIDGTCRFTGKRTVTGGSGPGGTYRGATGTITGCAKR